MQQLTGIIKEIHKPVTTKKGTPIQIISLRKNNHSFIYPQVHRNLELLDGLTVGDEILINYSLFGKEIESAQKKVHFHTIVIDKIIKL